MLSRGGGVNDVESVAPGILRTEGNRAFDVVFPGYEHRDIVGHVAVQGADHVARVLDGPEGPVL
jgi:hypothetical protein